MIADQLANGLLVFVSVSLLLGALRAWRLTSATVARETIFSARADLFLAAADKDAFEDSAYRDMESLLNGCIRWVGDINGFLVASILLRRHLDVREGGSEMTQSSAAVADDIRLAETRLQRALMKHLTWGTLSGFVLVSAMQLTNRLNRLWRATESYSRNMSTDDYVQQTQNPGKHFSPSSLCHDH